MEKSANAECRRREPKTSPAASVALLTGGADRPYAYGLAKALAAMGIAIDLIAGDDLDCSELRSKPEIRFLNLRGSQRQDAAVLAKALRVVKYYAKLIGYAVTARPRIFHILWNNRFELFDRTLLILFYKSLRKKIVLTVHNVNSGNRDRNDTLLNRLTLRIQYHLADHIFVHTEKMKCELADTFRVPRSRITVIPFGINNAVPNTRLTPTDARQQLGIRDGQKTILFFGNIAPYKGVEYLIDAFHQLQTRHEDFDLIIAGRPNGSAEYWNRIWSMIRDDVRKGRALVKADFIPDDKTEVYFKAADVFVLPYRYIYQSGVLFLGYSFGLPVLAADVGSLRDEVIEGKTGFVFRPEDSTELAVAIEKYFASELFINLHSRGQEICGYVRKQHCWDKVGKITLKAYAGLRCAPELA